MNNRCDTAQAWQQLFENVCQREGATVLPGCWGGDYAANRLAWRQNERGNLLLLGVVNHHPNQEAIQLDSATLGFTQLSRGWIRVVAFALQQHEGFASIADELIQALNQQTLTTALLVLDAENESMRVVPVQVKA